MMVAGDWKICSIDLIKWKDQLNCGTLWVNSGLRIFNSSAVVACFLLIYYGCNSQGMCVTCKLETIRLLKRQASSRLLHFYQYHQKLFDQLEVEPVLGSAFVKAGFGSTVRYCQAILGGTTDGNNNTKIGCRVVLKRFFDILVNHGLHNLSNRYSRKISLKK